MNASQARIVAYVILIVIAGFGLYRAQQAVTLARAVDHRGDIVGCQLENKIRSAENRRNASLEKTAVIVVRSLDVLSRAERAPGDNTNDRLENLAQKAHMIRVSFEQAPITDCEAKFPRP